jgi:hypothetical protein
MSSHVMALAPGVRTGGPRFDRDRWAAAVKDHWAAFQAILARACPYTPVPSPAREALAAWA